MFDESGSWVGATAQQIARAVRRGDTSATQVVADHLDYIQGYENVVNAFRLVRAGAAVAEAEAVDEQEDLANLPLAGVPIAVKENTAVAGLPTWYGSAAARTAVAEADHEVVRRLRGAGAVVVATSRMPELGLWGLTDDATAITRNPWRTDRTPGGSSGGAAAAVAAGLVPIAHGNDGLGSVRIPAACCGLIGIKPGRGVVPSPDAGRRLVRPGRARHPGHHRGRRGGRARRAGRLGAAEAHRAGPAAGRRLRQKPGPGGTGGQAGPRRTALGRPAAHRGGTRRGRREPPVPDRAWSSGPGHLVRRRLPRRRGGRSGPLDAATPHPPAHRARPLGLAAGSDPRAGPHRLAHLVRESWFAGKYDILLTSALGPHRPALGAATPARGGPTSWSTCGSRPTPRRGTSPASPRSSYRWVCAPTGCPSPSNSSGRRAPS